MNERKKKKLKWEHKLEMCVKHYYCVSMPKKDRKSKHGERETERMNSRKYLYVNCISRMQPYNIRAISLNIMKLKVRINAQVQRGEAVVWNRRMWNFSEYQPTTTIAMAVTEMIIFWR